MFKNLSGTSLVVQWLRLLLSMQGYRLDPWSEELRSHMPLSQRTKTWKQYCNKYNKGFKNGPLKKKKKALKEKKVLRSCHIHTQIENHACVCLVGT